MNDDFINTFLEESTESIKNINQLQIHNLVKAIEKVRDEKGRIFFLGVGGSAGNASHAVNDFRKLINVMVIIISGAVATFGYQIIPFKAYVIVAALSGLCVAFILTKFIGKKND